MALQRQSILQYCFSTPEANREQEKERLNRFETRLRVVWRAKTVSKSSSRLDTITLHTMVHGVFLGLWVDLSGPM